MGDTDVTRTLRRAREDRDAAWGELLPQVHRELRRLAAARLRRERSDHTLQPTALVHEAYLRLVDDRRADSTDRAEFLSMAAHAMQRVLLDHARRKRALKRGGGALRVTLGEGLEGGSAAPGAPPEPDVIDLQEELDRLAELHPRQAKVIELRFFGGLSFAESAQVLGIAPKTVEADWYFARTWLRRALKAGDDPPA